MSEMSKDEKEELAGLLDGRLSSIQNAEKILAAGWNKTHLMPINNEEVERYIASLPWSEDAKPCCKTLVGGNIFHFAQRFGVPVRKGPSVTVEEIANIIKGSLLNIHARGDLLRLLGAQNDKGRKMDYGDLDELNSGHVGSVAQAIKDLMEGK